METQGETQRHAALLDTPAYAETSLSHVRRVLTLITVDHTAVVSIRTKTASPFNITTPTVWTITTLSVQLALSMALVPTRKIPVPSKMETSISY